MISTLKKSILLISLFVIFFSGKNPGDWIFVGGAEIPHQQLFIGSSGSAYSINRGVLTQCWPPVSRPHSYSEKIAGDVSFVDATDPMNILVFFRDFGYIRYVDSRLAPRSPLIRLTDVCGFGAELVCHAPGFGFWMLSEGFDKLMLVDAQYQVRFSTNLSSLGIQITQPSMLVHTPGYLVLSDVTLGAFVFDVYGSYLFRIPAGNLRLLTVVGNNLVWSDTESLKIYNFKLHSESVFLLPEKGLKVLAGNRQEYIFGDHKTIYRYRLDRQLFDN